MLLIAPPGTDAEALLARVEGAETLPDRALDLNFTVIRRADKGAGHYQGLNYFINLGYGLTDRLDLSGALKFQSIDTSGLIVDGYLPEETTYGPRFAGVKAGLKFNYLRPAADGVGLSQHLVLEYDVLDSHSGQDKRRFSFETKLLAQAYFLEGALAWYGNAGLEAIHATRGVIEGLPEDLEWPTFAEVELEVALGTGASWRFSPNWYAGYELLYQTEFETEVGQERWSLFAGPSLHYGSRKWWLNLSALAQHRGGGERYENKYALGDGDSVPQSDDSLHLIEKTKRELVLKFGLNF